MAGCTPATCPARDVFSFSTCRGSMNRRAQILRRRFHDHCKRRFETLYARRVRRADAFQANDSRRAAMGVRQGRAAFITLHRIPCARITARRTVDARAGFREPVAVCRSVVEYDAEEGAVDLEAAVVFDEAKLAELVH